MIVLNRVDIAVTALSLVLLFSLYFFSRRSTHKNLRGPPAPSYLLGLEYELQTKTFEEGFVRWSKEYGTAYRLQGCLGETMLVVSDPLAIHRILHESLQDYPAAADVRRLFEMIFGKGVISVKGEDHKRHRRVLGPAFSINHMRQFLPLFQRHVNHLSEKWDTVLQGKTQTIDIILWLHKLALDIVGESAFNYHFDALNNKPNELTTALYAFEKLAGEHTPTMTLIQAILRHIPDSIVSWKTKHFPFHGDKVVKRFLEVSNEKAREFLKKAGLDLDLDSNEAKDETGMERDILSILARANRAEDPRKRLSEEEMLSQMSTIIQAGHHTTGYTISWILYQLAAHPEDQAKVYEEIRQETFRLHPPVPKLEREASKNDILLLDFPVVCRDGTTIDAVPVRKGQRIKVDITSYNRLESVWGEDADSWNPKRFEPISTHPNGKEQTQVGLFANVLTFSGGPKGCLG
ncbi:hypothetical protein E1B28_002096 [Marasmius oreades]|uniref:Cytochrome P450 n=1 Tax=Marasmius oreades TaxID=181124 RepID=A0A9P7RMM6_9AGAR|nr:uncharacterized protein E1B28_002096 [Marasmius oreades]KAG7086137.1 hypothetical protein E1B28_002096 [Marasmius oreades]